jgi:hypothetical protein
MLLRFSLILGLFLIICFPAVGGAAEPNLKIRLLTGSEIRADKAWVQGDRLVYERYGTTGSVRMVDVAGLIDRELEVLVAACLGRLRDAQTNLEALDRAARAHQDRSTSAEERAAIASVARSLGQQELGVALGTCTPALEKYDRNKRMFDEAREKAKR